MRNAYLLLVVVCMAGIVSAQSQAAAAKAEADQKAEAARQEEARLAAEEQARQDEILARIRDTLAGASTDSKALSTGPAGVKSDDGDFALDP